MSAIFTETARALASDPELRAKVLSVTSADERRAILVEAGVPVPTHEEVNAHLLAGVAGGASSGSTKAPYKNPSTQVNVAAADAAGAAACA